jgi:hypothetical protein
MTQDVIQAGLASAGRTKQPIAVLLQMLVLNITFWILALPITILFAIVGGVIVGLFRLISATTGRRSLSVRGRGCG